MSTNEDLTFKEVMERTNEIAHDKGHWTPAPPIPEFLCQVHGEVSEALEANKCGKETLPWDLTMCQERIDKGYRGEFKNHFEKHVKNSFEDELGDIILRVLDYCKENSIDIQTHILLKMEYNSMREYKHGKKY